jgi:hypothetical protein
MWSDRGWTLVTSIGIHVYQDFENSIGLYSVSIVNLVIEFYCLVYVYIKLFNGIN